MSGGVLTPEKQAASGQCGPLSQTPRLPCDDAIDIVEDLVLGVHREVLEQRHSVVRRVDDRGGDERAQPVLLRARHCFDASLDLGGEATSVDFGPALASFAAGQEFRFTLDAAPVPSIFQQGARGKRVPTNPAELLPWLERKGADAGFALLDGAEAGERRRIAFTRRVSLSEAPYILDNKPAVTLATVRYAGRLAITDPDRFRTALTCGIGPSKAYGRGFLLLGRP